MTISSSLAPFAAPLLVRPCVEARPLWPPRGDTSIREASHATAFGAATGLGPATGAGIGGKTVQRLCDAAMLATAAAFALPVGELNAPTRRSPYAAFARQSAMYLAHVAFGLTYTEIGRGFRRDRTTAAYACRLVEDWRDDPAVDAVLSSLENACGALRRRLTAKVLP
jgi:hypothetical protein